MAAGWEVGLAVAVREVAMEVEKKEGVLEKKEVAMEGGAMVAVAVAAEAAAPEEEARRATSCQRRECRRSSETRQTRS